MCLDAMYQIVFIIFHLIDYLIFFNNWWSFNHPLKSV